MINENFEKTKSLEPAKTETEKRNVFKGPYIEKMKVLRAGNFRLKGILYNMLPGEFIDGSLLTPSKREILLNTKFISKEGGN